MAIVHVPPANRGLWYEVDPLYVRGGEDGLSVIGEGDPIIQFIDRSGKGNHAVVGDERFAWILRTEGGAWYAEMNGQGYYLIGAPGALNFASFTLVAAIRRGKEISIDENGVSYPTPANQIPQRNLINVPRFASGTNNARWEVYFTSGSFFGWVIGGGTGGTSTVATNVDRVISVISNRSIGRVQGDVKVNPGTTGRVITYTYTGQALLGAGRNAAGEPANFALGRFNGLIVTDRDEGDPMTGREEITTYRLAGKEL